MESKMPNGLIKKYVFVVDLPHIVMMMLLLISSWCSRE